MSEQEFLEDDLAEIAARPTTDERDVRRELPMDFVYDQDQNRYWHVKEKRILDGAAVDSAVHTDHWPAGGENARGEPRLMEPHKWLRRKENLCVVEGSIWWPGKPDIIEGYVAVKGGLKAMAGGRCFNTYMAPSRGSSRGKTADLWLEHVRWIAPDPLEHEHFLDVAAHMVQKPHEKCNHGILLAGAQGIGKDSLLKPLQIAVGTNELNEQTISPDRLFDPFNPHVKTVMLVINEARPLDSEHKASAFYELLKPLLAAPPETLSINEKNLRPVRVRNVCRVFITTNSPLDMFIPPDDRRLFVIASQVEKREADYYAALHSYLDEGGAEAVVAWLAARDLRKFNPAATPPMTLGKELIIDCASEVRRSMIDDVLDAFIDEACGGVKPEVLFSRDLQDFVSWARLFDNEAAARDALKAKNVSFKLASRGYDRVPHPTGAEWRRGREGFRSRSAYVLTSASAGRADRRKLVEQALWRRPIDFSAAAKELGDAEIVDLRPQNDAAEGE